MITSLIALGLAVAGAEQKTCVVKGMVCQNCVEMVQKNVCTEDLAACDVRLKDKNKHLGEITFVTKDPAGKVDLKRVDDELQKLAYALDQCRPGVTRR